MVSGGGWLCSSPGHPAASRGLGPSPPHRAQPIQYEAVTRGGAEGALEYDTGIEPIRIFRVSRARYRIWMAPIPAPVGVWGRGEARAVPIRVPEGGRTAPRQTSMSGAQGRGAPESLSFIET